jgi:hypothetical protein
VCLLLFLVARSCADAWAPCSRLQHWSVLCMAGAAVDEPVDLEALKGADADAKK